MMQETSQSFRNLSLKTVTNRPRISVVDTYLSIDEYLIDLKSSQRMLKLLKAFLDTQDYRMDRERIYNYVYRQDTRWIDLSSRYQMCMVQNINKLVSRTRFFISKQLQSHKHLAQFDWFSFDREQSEWILFVSKPYQEKNGELLKLYH